jgi:hypothetical protein
MENDLHVGTAAVGCPAGSARQVFLNHRLRRSNAELHSVDSPFDALRLLRAGLKAAAVPT